MELRVISHQALWTNCEVDHNKPGANDIVRDPLTCYCAIWPLLACALGEMVYACDLKSHPARLSVQVR
jgi:hypothetical protein